MRIFEDIAFCLIERGHSPIAVMNYEISFLLGYALMKMERNQPAKKPASGGWVTDGKKRKKTMTSDQMLRKVRSQKGK